MTKREMIIAALEHQETPIVPWQIKFTKKAEERLIGYTNDVEVIEKIGNFIHFTQWTGDGRVVIEGRPGYRRDGFGAIWNMNAGSVGDVTPPYVIEALEDTKFQVPPINADVMRKLIGGHVAGEKDKFCVVGLPMGIFEQSWSLMGMENVHQGRA